MDRKKIVSFFENTLAVLCAILLLWMLASMIDINLHNLSDKQYHRWNAIVLLFPSQKEHLPNPDKPDECDISNIAEKVVEFDEPDLPAGYPDIKDNAEHDIYRLAQLMQAENGGSEYDMAVLLTGIVVMKRVKSNYYPDTIEDVISQPGQYETYQSGRINCRPDERCLEMAEAIIRKDLQRDYPDGLVYQAEFEQGSIIYAKYGTEYFCLK